MSYWESFYVTNFAVHFLCVLAISLVDFRMTKWTWLSKSYKWSTANLFFIFRHHFGSQHIRRFSPWRFNHAWLHTSECSKLDRSCCCWSWYADDCLTIHVEWKPQVLRYETKSSGELLSYSNHHIYIYIKAGVYRLCDHPHVTTNFVGLIQNIQYIIV